MAKEKDFKRMDLREKERYIRSLSPSELERFNKSETLRNMSPEQQRNEQRRQAEKNRYYNDPKARTERANAERDAARKSADRLKPPAAPATSTAPSAKKSAITRMIEGFKSGAGKGGRIGGLGALRTGGGVPRVK
jgi:hypothetical protein